MQKPVRTDVLDELTEKMNKMEAHLVNLRRNRPPVRNVRCRSCGKPGHSEQECFRNQICRRCNKKGHIEHACREVIGYNTNYLDDYETSELYDKYDVYYGDYVDNYEE